MTHDAALVDYEHRSLGDVLQSDHVRIDDVVLTDHVLVEVAEQRKSEVLGVVEGLQCEKCIHADAVDLSVRLPERGEAVDHLDAHDVFGLLVAEVTLDPQIVRVAPTPRRAFQGWRYLQPKDAPEDLAQDLVAEIPPELARQLRELGAW